MSIRPTRRLVSTAGQVPPAHSLEGLEPRVMLSVAIEQIDLAAGDGPEAVVVADFDGDGLNDIASANFEGESLSVFLNEGDGLFADAIHFEINGRPESIFSVDVNEDGLPDLGVFDSENNGIVLLENLGDGQFEVHDPIPVGEGATNFLLSDLDNDDSPDIIVTYDTGVVTVFHPGLDNPFDSGDEFFGAVELDQNFIDFYDEFVGTFNAGGTYFDPFFEIFEMVFVEQFLEANEIDVDHDDLSDFLDDFQEAHAEAIHTAFDDPANIDAAIAEELVLAFWAEFTPQFDIVVDLELQQVFETFADETITGWADGSLNDNDDHLPDFIIEFEHAFLDTFSDDAEIDLPEDDFFDWADSFYAENGDQMDALFGYDADPAIGDVLDFLGTWWESLLDHFLTEFEIPGLDEVLASAFESFADEFIVMWDAGEIDPDFGEFHFFIDMFEEAFIDHFLDGPDALPLVDTAFFEFLDLWAPTFFEDPNLPDQPEDALADFGEAFMSAFNEEFAYTGDQTDGGDGNADGTGDEEEFAPSEDLRNFMVYEDYDLGSYLFDIVVADFTEDGWLDVAFSDPHAGEVHFLINDGDGMLEGPYTFDVGPEPSSIAAGDVNGDGAPDLLVTSEDGNTLGVMLNNQVDGLDDPIFVDVGRGPVFVGVVDIDGDGRMEFITANEKDGTLSIVAVDDAGDLVVKADLIAGDGTSVVIGADLDGDDLPELITANTDADTLTVFSFDFLDGDEDPFLTPAPSAPDLVAASDTGVSDTDDITALDNSPGAKLSFLVSDVTEGATVRLYAGNFIIGTAVVADGQTTVTILTNGQFVLDEGLHLIKATQIIGGIESASSTALTVEIKLPHVDTDEDVEITENENGETVVVIADDTGGTDVQVNLSQIADAPAITGKIIATTDPKAGDTADDTYAAGQTDAGFVLFSGRADGEWKQRNLTTEISGAEAITSNALKAYTTPWGFVNFVGFNERGDLLVYWQDGDVTEDGEFAWQFVNLYDEQLRALGQGTPDFVGDITVYVTPWGGLNIAGLDEDGNLQVVWWAPAAGHWVSTNLTDQLGGDALTGRVSASVDLPDTMRLFATTADGDLVMYHWDPDGEWQITDVSEAAGENGLATGTVGSFVTDDDVIVAGAYDEAGDSVSIFWFTADVGDWQAVTIDIAEAPLVGKVTGVEAADGTLSVFAQTAGDTTVELTYDAGGDAWSLA